MISCFPASESPYSSTSGREDAAHPSTKAPRPERCTRTLRGRAGGRVHVRARALTHSRILRHETVPAGHGGGQDLSNVWPLRASVLYFRFSSSSQTHAAPQGGPVNSRRQSVATDPPPRRGTGRGICFGSPSRLAPLNLHIFLPVQQHAGLAGRKWYTEFNHFDVYLFFSLQK